MLFLIQSSCPFKGYFFLISLGSSSWTRVDGRLVRVSDQRDMDSQLVTVDQFFQRCSECKMHGDLIHVPPSELHALTSSWPFSVWGIDIIEKISPKSYSGHEFILVSIDYFTKWVEVASYARLTSAKVASFIRSHIICRHGVPHELISDRGSHFRAEVDTLLQRYGVHTIGRLCTSRRLMEQWRQQIRTLRGF